MAAHTTVRQPSLRCHRYGERVTINFQSDGALMVSSRCVFPLQVIDLGKNASNIKQLLEAVEQQVLPQSLPKTS